MCTIPADAFTHCQKLKILYLLDNEINDIHEGAFDGLDKLTEIRLNNNELRRIPDILFKDCKALEILDLENNKINEIVQRTFDGLEN